MTEKDIIQGCKTKEAIYQKALVKEYAPMLLSVCRRYARNRSEAEDVLQESLIKIFKSIHSFCEEKGQFKAWIRKIAVNTSLRYFDKNCFKKQHTGLEGIPQTAIEPSILSQMNAEDLMQLVARLPEGYRQVFNLYAIEGYSHKEISGMVGIGESSSRSNLARARAVLQGMLKKQVGKKKTVIKVHHEYQ